MFFNTGIATYVWVLSNRKPKARRGKLQLIDASSFWRKMRKSLGSKRKELGDEHIAEITRLFGKFEEAELVTVLDAAGKETARAVLKPGAKAPPIPEGGKSKRAPLSRISPNTAFGYRTITVERPLRDEAGKVVVADRGKAKGKPVPDASLRDTENVPLGGGGNLLRPRSCATRARRLDRPREDESRLRDPVQPPLLRLRAAPPARSHRR
jgi:type I restriction enzyme M protein